MSILTSPIPGAPFSSDRFGPRRPIDTDGDGDTDTDDFHDGQDFDVPANTPIRAAGDGVVIASGRMGGYGYAVYIDHGDGLNTRYAHMIAQPPVSVGWHVDQGSVIGYVGSTGDSTGPHLHFEVELFGVRVDPIPYLTTTHTTPTGQEADEDMAKNSGFYYESADLNGITTTTYLVLNTSSGFYSEYTNGPGRGPMDGGYNTAVATTMDTGSFAKISADHAKVLKASCERVLGRA